MIINHPISYSSDRYDLLVSQWGPHTGSSIVRVFQDKVHGRFILHAMTDFGQTACGFSRDQLRELAENILKATE